MPDDGSLQAIHVADKFALRLKPNGVGIVRVVGVRDELELAALNETIATFDVVPMASYFENEIAPLFIWIERID